MKKKLISIIFLIFIFLFVFSLQQVYAHTVGEVFSDGWVSTGNSIDETIQSGQVTQVSKLVYKILLAIGIAIMFIVGTIIGIKFIIAGVEDKAKIKEQLIPYFVGCAVILGAFTIWGMAVNIMQNTTSGSEARTPTEHSEPEQQDPEEDINHETEFIIASKPKRVQRKYELATSIKQISAYTNTKATHIGTIVDVPDKKILIYLPYDYSEKKQYDVLLLLHGSGGNKNDWLKWNVLGGFTGKDIIDNVIEKELCDPLIIVTTSYEVDEFQNGGTETRIKDEILPYVVRNYSTYAECDESDSTQQVQNEIIKQRDHFGVAGLSLGAILTETLIQNRPDIFSWFGCFSGYIANLNINQNYKINYIYFAAGRLETNGTYPIMETAYNRVKNNPSVLNSSFEAIEGGHQWKVWYVCLYNILQLFFDY